MSGGLAWMTINTLVGRVLTLLAQLLLAKLLLPAEFGEWAIALSLATMAKTLQDMGIRELLVQRDHDDSPTFVSSVAFLGVLLNVGSAAVLVTAGFTLADVYGSDDLPMLCALVAAQTLILGNWAVNGALLRRDLRFRPVALIEIAGLLTLFGGQITAALLGAGVYAFAIPLVLSGIVRTGLGMAVARRRIYRVRPSWRIIRAEARPLGWLLVGALSFALLQQADYLMLGFYLTSAELGFYFFAYQIAAQVGVLISNNLQIVMFPVLSRMIREGQSIDNFSRRMSRTLLAAGCLMSSVVLMLFGPFEVLLYGGKWAGANTAVAALALAFPLRALFVLPRSTLLAMGRFSGAATLTAFLGGGLLVVALLVGLLEPTAVAAAVAIAIYLGATGLIVAGVFGRLSGNAPLAAGLAVLVPYLLWAVPAAGLYVVAGGAGASLPMALAALATSSLITAVLWRTFTPPVWSTVRDVARQLGRRLGRSRSGVAAGTS